MLKIFGIVAIGILIICLAAQLQWIKINEPILKAIYNCWVGVVDNLKKTAQRCIKEFNRDKKPLDNRDREGKKENPKCGRENLMDEM